MRVETLESRDRHNSATKANLEDMSVDDLWTLHEEISRILSARIVAEKRELEKRLAVLNRGIGRTAEPTDSVRIRRKYPRVLPKYRNPQKPAETWSGRGKRPRWLVAAMKSGRKIEEFRIGDGAAVPKRAAKSLSR